jgi:hypothetical protein
MLAKPVLVAFDVKPTFWSALLRIDSTPPERILMIAVLMPFLSAILAPLLKKFQPVEKTDQDTIVAAKILTFDQIPPLLSSRFRRLPY